MTSGDVQRVEAANDGMCPEWVWGGDEWHPFRKPCGRRVKRGGLCGVHANVADRRHAAEEQRKIVRLLDQLPGHHTMYGNRALAEQIVAALTEGDEKE